MGDMDQASEEQWHVQIEAGDVRLWTLDQLDAAFKAEVVDESTFVLEVGKTEWMQLGTLLGGGDDDGENAEAPAAPPAAAHPADVPSYAPTAPVMIKDSGPPDGPYSVAPTASDIDDELPDSFRSSRKRPVAIGLGVALIAAGVAAFVLTRGGAAHEAPAAVAAAVAPPPVSPAVADPPSAPETQAAVQARLSREQLLKLAEADREREAKVAAQQKARAAAAPHSSHGSHAKEKGPFQSGGDEHDPLNAKL